MNCAACGVVMDGVQTGEGRLEVCRACSCMLVPQRLLARLLERASRRLRGKVDPNVPIEPLPAIAEHPGCPACHRSMSRDDYCQAGVVRFSRCDRCELLWLHTEQLAVMSVMWARMDGRLEALQAADRAMLAEVSSYVDCVLWGRAVSDLMFDEYWMV